MALAYCRLLRFIHGAIHGNIGLHTVNITLAFANKVNNRSGGVAFGADLVVGHILTRADYKSKSIPVLRNGLPSESVPHFPGSRLFIDFESAEGNLMAHFISELSSVVPDLSQVNYYGQGFHATEANIRWSGYGDLTFKREDISGNFIQCQGKFFNIHEYNTKEWEMKTTKCKRETDKAVIGAMLNGSEKQKAAIIIEINENR